VAFGSVNPRFSKNMNDELKRIMDWGIRGIKLHPPHQLFSPNDYLSSGHRNLEELYRFCELKKLPVMFHTGTSIFPGARNRFGNPISIDDVAVDFPNLKIILAHGGRPLWQQESFFLVRRHPNVYLEISGIPPSKIKEYFPRLEEVANKTLFGTDWPGPGVRSIADNLGEIKKLNISEEAKENILHKTAAGFFGG
jgi:predicted TIM-barrel fold metal-dependent hydrolase